MNFLLLSTTINGLFPTFGDLDASRGIVNLNRHFRSKEELAAEAFEYASSQLLIIFALKTLTQSFIVLSSSRNLSRTS